MAFRKTLTQRLFSLSRATNLSLTTCRISSPCSAAKSAILSRCDSPRNNADHDMFRRYIHRGSSTTLSPPELRLFPTGEKLAEKIQELGFGQNKDRFEGMVGPGKGNEEITVMDARKILKVSQLEKVKERLKGLEMDCVTYSEFLEICGRDCASFDQGMEFAEILDQSGCVIVIGNNVFLRPDKVVKAIQGLIQTPYYLPNHNDPMLKELQELETQKTPIDKKAEFLVRRELWCGLGYLIVQTAAFMRLTFWELTWDVMEPICFYVTSMYFFGGYAFFLRTAKEPSFEGFFQSRFVVKQKRLMKAHKFDLERYNVLKKACYPHSSVSRENSASFRSTGHDIALRRQ